MLCATVGKMKKVFLKYTEGCCWRRIMDAEVLMNYFLRNGWEIAPVPEAADLCVLITCAFVKLTEEIAVRDVSRFRELPGELLVSGCLPGINKRRLDTIFDGRSIPIKNISEIDSMFPEHKYRYDDIEDTNFLFEQQKKLSSLSVTAGQIAKYFLRYARFDPRFYAKAARNMRVIARAKMGANRRVYYLRIGKGCGEPHCTFCVEWMAVGGTFISKPLDMVLEEVRRGLDAGYTRFAVLSDNPGGYGVDTGSSIAELLRSVLAVSDKITISTIDGFHPYWIIKHIDELVPIFAEGRIKFVMTPLQSGSDRILELMNRRYTAGGMKAALAKLRAADPGVNFNSQAVIGFPTETEEDFQATLRAIEEMEFLNMTVFPYSRLEVTAASKIEPHVPDDEIQRRVARARDFLGRKGIFSFQMGLDIQRRFFEAKQPPNEPEGAQR